MSKRKCKHTTSRYTWRRGESLVAPSEIEYEGTEVAIARHCYDCGATLSLGPSNDEPEAVRMEMRSAELDLWVTVDGLAPSEHFRIGERLWWVEHGIEQRDQPGDRLAFHGQLAVAGYLARELATHDDRETRDADAWPWDPSRAVAGQWEEWGAKNDLKINDAGDLIQSIPADPQRNGLTKFVCRTCGFVATAKQSHIGCKTYPCPNDAWRKELGAPTLDPVRELARKIHDVLDADDAAATPPRRRPTPTNADGDPVDFATERMAAGIAVEDALRAEVTAPAESEAGFALALSEVERTGRGYPPSQDVDDDPESVPSDDPFGPVLSPAGLDEVERVMTGAVDICPDCNGPSYRCTRRKLDGGE